MINTSNEQDEYEKVLSNIPDVEEMQAPFSTNEAKGVQKSEEQDLIQRTTLIIDSLSGDMEKDLQVIRERLAPVICEMKGALPEYFIDIVVLAKRLY